MIKIFTCLLLTSSIQLIAAEGPQCPSKVPRSGSSCNLEHEESCGYSPYCCCGSCINTTHARCKNGRWSISVARLLPCDAWPACKKGYLLSQTIGAGTLARDSTISAGGLQCLQCLLDHAPRCISKYCGTKSGVVCAQCLYIENADICRAPCGVDDSQSLPIQRVLDNNKGNCRTAYFVCEDEASTKPAQGCRSICNVPLRFDTLGSTLGLETAAGLPMTACKAVYFLCNENSKPLPFSETCMTCCKDFHPVEQRGKPHSCNRRG